MSHVLTLQCQHTKLLQTKVFFQSVKGGADSDDEDILKLNDLQAPELLKVKSYSEASSELNRVSDFFTTQGESNLADELCKIIQSSVIVCQKQLANAVQKNITDFFNTK